MISLLKITTDFEAAWEEYNFWNGLHMDYAKERYDRSNDKAITSDKVNTYFNTYWEDMDPTLKAGIDRSVAELVKSIEAITKFYNRSKLHKLALDFYVNYVIKEGRRDYYVKILPSQSFSKRARATTEA